MYTNDERCDIYAKSVVRVRLHLPQMEEPDTTQFGNQMVHDVGSGCFGIFRSEPLGIDPEYRYKSPQKSERSGKHRAFEFINFIPSRASCFGSTHGKAV